MWIINCNAKDKYELNRENQIVLKYIISRSCKKSDIVYKKASLVNSRAFNISWKIDLILILSSLETIFNFNY